MGGGSEGGAPVSDCSNNGGACVPLPAGFQGAALLDVDCSNAATVFDGHDSYAFEPATCGCSCISSDTCGVPGTAQAFGAPLCNTNNGITSFSVVDDCIVLPAVPDAQSISLVGVGTPPECESDLGAPTIPPIDWVTPIIGCGFQSIGCGDDICVPGPDQRYCFYRDVGDAPLPCPDGLVDTRVLQKRDVGDSRDCLCECGEKLSDGCGNPQWSLFSDGSCNDIFAAVQSLCGDGGGKIGSAMVTLDSQVSCAQSQVPTGTVVVVPTIQACCSPP